MAQQRVLERERLRRHDLLLTADTGEPGTVQEAGGGAAAGVRRADLRPRTIHEAVQRGLPEPRLLRCDAAQRADERQRTVAAVEALGLPPLDNRGTRLSQQSARVRDTCRPAEARADGCHRGGGDCGVFWAFTGKKR